MSDNSKPPLEALRKKMLKTPIALGADNDDEFIENMGQEGLDYVDCIMSEFTSVLAVEHSDLAWCLGKLRGLGHPAEYLEKQYNIGPQGQSTGGTEK